LNSPTGANGAPFSVAIADVVTNSRIISDEELVAFSCHKLLIALIASLLRKVKGSFLFLLNH